MLYRMDETPVLAAKKFITDPHLKILGKHKWLIPKQSSENQFFSSNDMFIAYAFPQIHSGGV